MDQDLQKKITDRMAELPDDVRQAVESTDLGKKLREIGARHHLHLDQMGRLEDETLLVMLAFAEPAEFAQNLSQQLNISQADADSIATEVANEIFVPIRQSMQDFVEERALLETLAGEPAPPESPQKKELPVPVVPLVPAHKAAAPPVTPTTSTPTLHPADMMLSQKTVTVPPPANTSAPPPAKPTGYKADPYREPPVP